MSVAALRRMPHSYVSSGHTDRCCRSLHALVLDALGGKGLATNLGQVRRETKLDLGLTSGSAWERGVSAGSKCHEH